MCLRRRVSCSRCRQGIALSAPREHPSPHRSDHADEINQSWLMLEVIALCAACQSGNMIVRSACACGRSICCNTSSATVRPSRCAKRILPEAHPNSVLREAEQMYRALCDTSAVLRRYVRPPRHLLGPRAWRNAVGSVVAEWATRRPSGEAPTGPR